MRKRPWSILAASLLFLYFPVEWAVRYWWGAPWVTPEFVVRVCLPLVVWVGLVRVTRLGWYSLIAFTLVWGIQDVVGFHTAQGTPWGSLGVHLAIFALTLGYFITPRVRTLYFDPSLCWWKTKRRHETHQPLIVWAAGACQYPVLLNVSVGGCFVQTSHPLEVDTPVQVAIPLPVPLEVPVIRATGRVRWVSRNPLRTGMGIEFDAADALHKKAIRQYVQHML